MRGKPIALATFILVGTALSRQVAVESQDSLRVAMRDAIAGDTILVAPGTYTGSTSQSGDPGNLPNGTGYFWIGNDGTALHPIVVVAQDPARPPVLQGTTVSSGYVVHVTGDHVTLKNLILQTGDKVLVFDNASHGLVEDCELRNSGNEILHIRDASSNVVIHRSVLHNSGNVAPNFGEGIYIGTDQARWGADDVPQTGTVAPWWGDKAVSEDSNTCRAADNTVAASLPADPRRSCRDAYFDFHSPDYGGPAGIRAQVRGPAATGTNLVLDGRFQTLRIVDLQGRRWSPIGRTSRH